MPPPTALDSSRRCRLASIGYEQPLLWLAAGWRDLLRSPRPGLLHGLAVSVFGLLLLWVAHRYFWLLAGAFSGFLFIGPLAATGALLYREDTACTWVPGRCARACTAWRRACPLSPKLAPRPM